MDSDVGADVLIAGAGPAGTVAAIRLARRGLRVDLVDKTFSPLNEDYDLQISARAVRELSRLGIAERAQLRGIDVIDLRSGAASGHEITNCGIALCTAGAFRKALRDSAISAGARFVPGTVTSVTRRNGIFHVPVDGTVHTARHLVDATGAAEAIKDKPGRADTVSFTGIACAQRFRGTVDDSRIVLAVAIPPGTNPHDGPVCSWLLPGADGVVTVGAARIGEAAQAAVPEDLIGVARQVLASHRVLPQDLSEVGPLCHGALHTGFTPVAAKTGQMLIGEAAGLVNPFTGEGISAAMQSAALAADAIAGNRDDAGKALAEYARRAERAFAGYFETTGHAARRYHLTWRVLGAAAGSDHPFFVKARRAILLPDDLTTFLGGDILRLEKRDAAFTGPFLIACDDVVISSVRREWPFLARLLVGNGQPGGHRMRPALLFLAGFQAEKKPAGLRYSTAAAAVELATLGMLALLGAPAARRAPDRGVDWTTTTTVIAGDYLVAEAYRLIAESAPEISWSFTDWLAELAALRAAGLEQGTAGYALRAEVFGSLFEFPARMGAFLGGGSPQTAEAMREFGWNYGRAFLHAEDLLALRGERTRLDTTRKGMVEARISAVPESVPPECAKATSAIILNAELERALEAISKLPGQSSRRILTEFVRTLASVVRDDRVATEE